MSVAQVYRRLSNNEDVRPVLDFCPGEKREIAFYNVTQGLSIASAIAGFAPTAAHELIGFNVVSETAAATLAPALILGGFTLVGAGVGTYLAIKQINQEQEKVFRLNKELFLLFNIAADRLQNCDSKLDPLENDDYFEAIAQLDAAMSGASVCTKPTSGNIPFTIRKMHDAITAYKKHRESAQGKDERELWKLLKQEDVYHPEKTQYNHFVNYSTTQQVNEFFLGEGQAQAEKFAKHSENLLHWVAKGRETLKEGHKLYDDSVNALKSILAGLFDLGILIARKTIKSSVEQEQAMHDFLEEASNAYAAIKGMIQDVEEIKTQVELIWESDLKPLIAKARDHISRYSRPESNAMQIIAKTNIVFGQDGTFRQFWRNIPQPEEKSSPTPSRTINFDQLIVRRGEGLDWVSIGKSGAYTTAALYGAGQGLYFACVALGAAAMSATVVGAIIVGLAIAIAILSVVYYARTTKAQHNRNELEKGLTNALGVLMPKERVAKQAESAPVPNLSIVGGSAMQKPVAGIEELKIPEHVRIAI